MVIRAQESGSLTQRDELGFEHTRDTFFWTTVLYVLGHHIGTRF